MKRILCVVCVLLISASRLPAEDDAAAESILNKLTAATIAKDYDAFVANGTTHFQAAFSKTQFQASAEILNPLLTKDHETTFLGELNQHGFEVYLYRLHFADGSDDILGTLSLKDGKVAGILFR